MFSAKYFAFLCGILTVIDCTLGEPDSAGDVPLPNGLAYGGIPYGSVSGMLAYYPRQQLNDNNYYNNNNNYYYPQSGQYKRSSYDQLQSQLGSQIIITPNIRASGLSNRKNGPFQIYKSPGVIAPGVIGTFSQIGY